MKTIGFLNSVSESACADLVSAFKRGLQEAGFTVGQNVAIEFRWANGQYDQLQTLASELVNRKVDVIAATGGIVSAKAALAATSTIPVLFVSGCDAVRAGLVTDAQRPSGNATGVQVSTTEAMERRLTALRSMVPGAAKIALLVNPRSFVAQMEDAHGKSANLLVLKASTASEIDAAFDKAAAEKAGAVLVSADPFFTSQRHRLVAAAARTRLPASYPWREYTAAGGLMSEGPSLEDAYREIGVLAGKILNGAKPSALPVKVVGEADFKRALNDRTAQSLNLRAPANLTFHERL